jgi:hypothetical protein
MLTLPAGLLALPFTAVHCVLQLVVLPPFGLAWQQAAAAVAAATAVTAAPKPMGMLVEVHYCSGALSRSHSPQQMVQAAAAAVALPPPSFTWVVAGGVVRCGSMDTAWAGEGGPGHKRVAAGEVGVCRLDTKSVGVH